METATSTIEVIRNVSITEEMGMTTNGYTLRAEVTIADGKVQVINNGTVSAADTQLHLGSFNVYGAGSLNLNPQSVTSRDIRTAMYEAVENFVAAIEENVNNSYMEA